MTAGLRARAWLALGAFLGGLVLPIVSPEHPADDDQAPSGLELFCHHPWSEIATVLPPVVPEHCAICHWERALSCASASTPVEVTRQFNVAEVRRADAAVSAFSLPIRHGSSRAPPSAALA
jgi:hypothetical protein